MVYSQAHYAPGFGERYEESDPLTTLSRGAAARAQLLVRRCSGSARAAYFATAYGDADEIVDRVLTQPGHDVRRDLRAGNGYSRLDADGDRRHPDVAGAQIWVQKTVIDGFHFGDPDYWYAFAGDPGMARIGADSFCERRPSATSCGSPFCDDIVWLAEQGITTGCGGRRFCPNGTVTRGQMATLPGPRARPARRERRTTSATTTANDARGRHQPPRRGPGITGGCADGRYCPDALVTREQMASFLARALDLAGHATPTTSPTTTAVIHEPTSTASRRRRHARLRARTLLPERTGHARRRWRPSCIGPSTEREAPHPIRTILRDQPHRPSTRPACTILVRRASRPLPGARLLAPRPHRRRSTAADPTAAPAPSRSRADALTSARRRSTPRCRGGRAPARRVAERFSCRRVPASARSRAPSTAAWRRRGRGPPACRTG